MHCRAGAPESTRTTKQILSDATGFIYLLSPAWSSNFYRIFGKPGNWVPVNHRPKSKWKWKPPLQTPNKPSSKSTSKSIPNRLHLHTYLSRLVQSIALQITLQLHYIALPRLLVGSPADQPATPPSFVSFFRSLVSSSFSFPPLCLKYSSLVPEYQPNEPMDG